MKKRTKEKRIIYVITIIVVIAAIVMFFAIKAGVFDKDPQVEIQANNSYDKTLTVVMGNDYAPFSFQKDGAYSGLDVELANEIGNRLHMNVKQEYYNWTKCLKKIQSGEADMVMSADYELEIDGVSCSIPTAANPWIAFSKDKIDSYADLYSKSIGVGEGTNPLEGSELAENYVVFESYDKAFEALEADKVDTVVAQYPVGTFIVNNSNYEDIKTGCEIIGAHLSIGVKSGNEELLKKVNAVVAEMADDGTLDGLNDKWCGTFVEHYSISEMWTRNPEYFVVAGIILFVLIILMILLFMRDKESRKETALREQIEEQNQLITELIKEYSEVFFVRYKENKMEDPAEPLFTGELFADQNIRPPAELPFSKKLDVFIENVVHPDDRDRVYETTRREVVLQNTADGKIYMVDFRAPYEGKTHYYQIRFARVGTAERTYGLVVGLRLMDEEVALRQQLREAKANAEAANEAKTSFLFNMSHDIRTPMNAIIGYTNMGLNHYQETELVKDSFEKIRVSSKHLLNLINDILEMSRIESGALELREEPADIREIVKNLSEMNESLALAKDLEYEATIDDIQDPYVYVDALHTNEVIINLISNAIKYTEPGGKVEFRVDQMAAARGNSATYRFVVKDTGIGISEEFQKHLFDSFARENTSTVSGQEGTGLGLSIVKRIVDLTQGTIDVKSAPGEGSEFTVVLPLRIMSEDAKADYIKEKEAIENPVEEINLAGKKVLLVEDNEMNREIATDLLTDAGLIIETANDGQMAVDMIQEKGVFYYNFILMDIQMPIMNGYEATAAIRELPDGDIIPIIALSANAFAEDIEKSLEAGMDAHVAKPIDVRTLMNTIAKLTEE